MNSPNLQQIPARDPELGPMIRSLFLPEEEQQWAAIDFSQQEPRILVHFAKNYGDHTKHAHGGSRKFCGRLPQQPGHGFSQHGQRNGGHPT
jgi:hypothetical protein